MRPLLLSGECGVHAHVGGAEVALAGQSGDTEKVGIRDLDGVALIGDETFRVR
jgi:hypothetical protein